MAEIRVDPITGDRAIVAGERAGRPERRPDRAARRADRSRDRPVRPGSRGPHAARGLVAAARRRRARHAGLDGPGRPEPLPGARAADAPEPEPSAAPELYTAFPARGSHEVIVNAPDAGRARSPTSSPPRCSTRSARGASGCAPTPAPPHVHLIVNERREAGASLPHTHAQLYALGFVPQLVARERERFGAYATRTMGGNLLADLVQSEVRGRERIVAIDDEAVLMAPYGSRLPYQLMLAPRRARTRFEDDGPLGAALLHDGLRRLARRFGASPPLNLWVRTAPRDAEHFCWRIDVVPRLTNVAGLELGHRRAPEHRGARAGGRGAARRVSAPSSSACRAPRCASTARKSRRSAPGCSCCSA